jgi:putative FmdB family regulatory protein
VPTYSYECTECGNRFDIVQAFTDDALITCEQCSGRLRKRFNSVGIVFKGSGFYRTDSRESAKSATNGTNGSAKNGSSESSGSTEKSGSSEKSGSAEKAPSTSNSSSSTPSPAAASS